MGLDAITGLFSRTRSEGRAAFLPYLTAGLPDPEASPGLFAVMAKAGADGFEVGIPYSDPLMDGPVVQRAGQQAIAAGADLDTSIRIVGQVKHGAGLPVLAMTYANPIFRRGVDAFTAALADAGADGIIVPDLPVEESGPLQQAARRHGLGLVQFVAPTSQRSRIEAVAAAEPAFIYAVAEMGVTGERAEVSGHLVDLVDRIRAVTDAPIVFGVGISGPEHAVAAARAGADGVIMGTAIVRRVLDAPSPAAAALELTELVTSVARALQPPG
jgi:tryptophan synthase alpha chain